MKKNIIALMFLGLSLVFFESRLFAISAPFDHSAWDNFLKQYVNEDGEVDYAGIKKDPTLLNQYVEQVAKISSWDFGNEWPREEKMALLINIYNAQIVKAIVDAYPVKSIQKIPGIWELEFFKVAGRAMSLNRLQKRDLVGAFQDEKIHTVLACGGKSCPKLRRDAFVGPKVEGQIFLAARDFVADNERNTIDPASKKVELSRLFKWYSQDFVLDFGQWEDESEKELRADEVPVIAFMSYYLEEGDKIRFLEEGKYKVKYKEFDWNLNEWHRPKDSTLSVSQSSN